MNRTDFNLALVGDANAGMWERGEYAPACARCGDSGIIGFEYTDYTRQSVNYLRCTCAATARRGHQSGNLDAYADKTFSTFIGLPSVASHAARCADYAANPSGWLLLASAQFGTGKSHLAMAMANAVNARGGSVYFATTPDLLGDLKATFDGGETETYTQRFERIRNTGLLILDDVGTEQATAFNAEKLFQLINHRYNRQMPLVITTNRFDQLDGRLRSRLGDVGLVERLDFDHAADYRSLDFAARRAV